MGDVVSILSRLKKTEDPPKDEEDADYWESLDKIIEARDDKVARDRKRHNQKICHDLKLKSKKE